MYLSARITVEHPKIAHRTRAADCLVVDRVFPHVRCGHPLLSTMNRTRQNVTSATANLSASRSRSAAAKRDSLTAELERGSYSPHSTSLSRADAPNTDPQFSSAKRQQRTNAFTSSMAHASLERQLLQVRSQKVELEAKLRERDSTIEQLEGDRRLLALRQQSEREEKEQEQSARETEQVRPFITIGHAILFPCPPASLPRVQKSRNCALLSSSSRRRSQI